MSQVRCATTSYEVRRARATATSFVPPVVLVTTNEARRVRTEARSTQYLEPGSRTSMRNAADGRRAPRNRPMHLVMVVTGLEHRELNSLLELQGAALLPRAFEAPVVRQG